MKTKHFFLLTSWVGLLAIGYFGYQTFINNGTWWDLLQFIVSIIVTAVFFLIYSQEKDKTRKPGEGPIPYDEIY